MERLPGRPSDAGPTYNMTCSSCGRENCDDKGDCEICGDHCCDKCAGSVMYNPYPVFTCFRCRRDQIANKGV